MSSSSSLGSAPPSSAAMSVPQPAAANDQNAIIMPSTIPKNLHFFEPWFLRFDTSVVPPRTPQTFY